MRYTTPTLPLLVLCLAGLAHAAPPADLAPHLELLTDGQGHYVALVPFASAKGVRALYSGGPEVMYQARLTGGGQSPNAFHYSVSDPRAEDFGRASVNYREDRGYWALCMKRNIPLTPVPSPDKERLLAAMRFEPPSFDRRPYALARDDLGTYYYVDRIRGADAPPRFRLFIGPRGGMKQAPLSNIISDSEGDIFATPDGALRLILDKSDARWVKRHKSTPLTYVPHQKNRPMIFLDLGIYDGQRLDSHCDDL